MVIDTIMSFDFVSDNLCYESWLEAQSKHSSFIVVKSHAYWYFRILKNRTLQFYGI